LKLGFDVSGGAGVLSPPARGRGLKPFSLPWDIGRAMSPPARGRGLKPQLADVADLVNVSPPARGRGLKLPNPRLAKNMV